MKNRKLNIRKRIALSIFLLLIGGIIFNSTFFLHTHRTALGKVVVHAHPFTNNTDSGNPLTQHEHNKIDLDHFSSFNYFTSSSLGISINYVPNLECDLLGRSFFEFNCSFYKSITTRGSPSKLILA